MKSQYHIPRALSAIRQSTNPAADAALIEALPFIDELAREAAIDLLIDRGSIPSLVTVLARFHDGDDVTQAAILRRLPDLHGAVRSALNASPIEYRAAALEAITAANEWQLAYAVADALQSKCPRTRELAAMTLGALVERFLGHSAPQRKNTTTPQSEQEQALADAANQALRTWELHLQPRALEAALHLGHRIMPALKQKLEERSTRIARAITARLSGTRDPRLAGFTVCALHFPELRQAAVSALNTARDPDFINAVINSAWLLDDPELAVGFRRVRQCHWLHESVDHIARLNNELAENAVRLLMASGGPHERKLDQLRALVTAGDEPMHRAVLNAAAKDQSPMASTVLNLLVSRGQKNIARAAAHELEQRNDGISRSATPDASQDDAASIRAALRSAQAFDRLRALTTIRDNDLTREFDEQVYHATHDSDPTIRSLAVAMLVDLPGATTERILRTAAEDADARVQANAIESLDRLNIPHRATSTRAKLQAKNNRVRANAVHSLLRLELREAGDALLNMLMDPSPAHRISALWVIERLGLSPVRMRIEELGLSDPDPRVRERARRVSTALNEFHPQPRTAQPERIAQPDNPTTHQSRERKQPVKGIVDC